MKVEGRVYIRRRFTRTPLMSSALVTSFLCQAVAELNVCSKECEYSKKNVAWSKCAVRLYSLNLRVYSLSYPPGDT